MAGVSTAASATSCEKPLSKRIVFKRRTAQPAFYYGRGPERPCARELRAGWIGSAKINDHNVVCTCDDVALSTSDRLHGTTPALPEF